jgi:hypothetical protein
MLIVERTSNGQSIVVIKKDWHPNRIGRAYQRPMQNNMQSHDAWRLQTAYLNKQGKQS